MAATAHEQFTCAIEQAILTILRHLGRLSEVCPLTASMTRLLYALQTCQCCWHNVLTALCCCFQLHCQMDEGKFENVYILL